MYNRKSRSHLVMSFCSHLVGAGGGRAPTKLVDVVDEVTSRSVGAESSRVERATQLRLVARMPVDRPQLGDAVSELALVAVPTRAARLLVRPTQLGLVARRIAAGRRRTVVRRRPTSATRATGRRSGRRRRLGPVVRGRGVVMPGARERDGRHDQSRSVLQPRRVLL